MGGPASISNAVPGHGVKCRLFLLRDAAVSIMMVLSSVVSVPAIIKCVLCLLWRHCM
jgi:hypothetical protein